MPKLKGEATKVQIELWKKKFPRIFKIQSEDSVAYVRKPNINDLRYASKAGMDDPLKLTEVLLKQCWLDGDEAIRTDEDKFLGVSSQMQEILKVAQTTIKEV